MEAIAVFFKKTKQKPWGQSLTNGESLISTQMFVCKFFTPASRWRPSSLHPKDAEVGSGAVADGQVLEDALPGATMLKMTPAGMHEAFCDNLH